MRDIFFENLEDFRLSEIYEELKNKYDYKTIRLIFGIQKKLRGYWIQYDKNHIPLINNGNVDGYILREHDNTINYRNSQIEKIIL